MGDTKNGSEHSNAQAATSEVEAKVSLYQQTVGCLQARDSKGVGNQYVTENKLIIQNK